MLLRFKWFRKSSTRALRRLHNQATIEQLEDRALLTASWSSFAGNPQHTDISQVAAQPVQQLLWSTSLDLEPWGAVHYGDPIFTPGDTVIVPVKVTWDGNTQGGNNFFLEGLNATTGAVEWTSNVTGSVTGASDASPIVITSPNNGLVTGETVSVGGVLGNTSADGTFTITVLNANQFQLNGTTGNGTYTGGGEWAYSPSNSSYIEPDSSWTPPYQPVYDPVTNRVYFPGPGGTLDYINDPDNPGSSTPTVYQEAFFGTSNYQANESAYNQSIFINTGLEVDSSGNVYFGFTETGTNPSGINDGGIAKVTPSGTGSYVLAATAVGQTNDSNWNPALGTTPALSNDDSTLYIGINDSGYALSGAGEYNAYDVGINTATMTPEYSVHLIDPASGSNAGMIAESTASVMVAPDGTVFQGVFGNPYNGSRGYLLHFSANLGTEFTPGAFGWDDTPSIVPASMVPSYTGTSSYLILAKYNNYANAEVGQPYGGNGVNQIAILDPYATQTDPNNDPNPNMLVMKQVMTIASPSPDIPNEQAGDPDAVREWCTNGSVVDPATDSVFVNNEDGYTYQWNLGTGLITNAVEVTSGIGVPYTPTAIGPNGEVFSDNGGTLFALGGYTNFTINTVSSANPAIVGNSITLTTTLASTDSGPTPTGTVTFSYYEGANNPLNNNTTPVIIGTENVVNGVASIPVSGLVAAHYHIYASYSGDGNYSAGQTIFVLPVLETVTTTVSAAANPVDAGTNVALTATVVPNGTSFVPIGTVTFMDGSTVLGTASLNNLEQETNPPSTNTATFTTSALPGGTDAITAIYSGDQNFTTDTSPVFDEYIPAVTNPGTQNSAVGDTVSLQVQASGLPTGDSWTFSATGLPSGLSIDTSTGAITGTITGSASSYSATVTAADGTKASASQSFTWNVSTLSETNPGTQNNAVGDVVSLQPQDSGLPTGDSWHYSATGLPSGLSISPTSGLITGTITGSAHTYAASVTASDGEGASVSQSFTWNVSAAATTTTLVGSPVNPTYGQTETLTATVSSDAGTPNDGTVTFFDGTTSLGTFPVSNGIAQFTSTTLTAGLHAFTATYIGDGATYAGSGTGTASIIQTVAGNGTRGYSGDGGPATSAELSSQPNIALDAAGDLFIADVNNNVIREVNAKTGVITTVAGNGTAGFSGDGGAATSAELNSPTSVAVDAHGDIFIADFSNNRIREVNAATGLISTIANINQPVSVAVDAAGNVLVAEPVLIQEVNVTTGVITTVAGNGNSGYNGDGIPATSASLDDPRGLAVDAAGNIFFADDGNNRVREVNASTGLISTIAGTGTEGYNGDGIPATSAELSQPQAVAVDAAGDIFIADYFPNDRVREVFAGTGTIFTVAGTGVGGYNGDGIPATSAELLDPTDVAVDAAGDLFIADRERIREVENGGAVVAVTPLVVNPGTENNAVGDTASLQVQASGLPSGDAWTYSATGLPSGLSINTSTGAITGTITGAANTYSVTIAAADEENVGASQTFTWKVSVLSETNPGTQLNGIGDTVSLPIETSGLPSGDSWTYSAAGLPSGLSINASTGLITGTITGSANTYSSSVTAKDGEGASVTQDFTWKVYYRPAITGPSSASVTENNSLTFSSANGNEISVSDQSAGSNSDSLTLSVSEGTIALGSTTGLTFTAGANGSASFTVTGIIGNLNAALNGLTYTPFTSYTGSDTLSVSLADPTDTLSTSSSVAITVNPFSAPAITAPSTATVSENGSLVFSSGNGNLISFTDNGIGFNADSMTISVNDGTLTLGTTNGLVFSSGSNDSAGFTVKGTVPNLNAALAGLTYQPNSGYAGSDTLSLSINDPTDNKSASTSVAINVSPLAPSITAPVSASLAENGSLAFSTGNGNAISLTDANPGSDSLTLSVSHGTLTLSTTSGLTITSGSNGTASFTVSGTISNLNAALNGLSYQPTAGYSGADTLAISLVDPGDTLSAAKNISLSINALAAPTITAPATATTLENNSLIFSSNAISVADSAAGSNSDSLSLSVAHGTITLSTTSGLTVTAGSNGSGSFTVTGTVANLNAALNNLTYAPAANYTGSDSLAISITDPGDNESGSKSVAITVNAYNPPSVTAPGSATVPENGSLVFSSSNLISVADSGPGNGSDSLQLTVSHGTVTFSTTSGLTITAGANGSATVTVTGSIANLNAALNGLTYKPTAGYTGADSLAISIKDSVDNLSGSGSVSISVNTNNPPSISAPTSARAQIGYAVVFSTANGDGIVITDTSAGGNVEELTVKATSGTLKLATTSGLTFISGSNNSISMTVEGTLANLNAALNGLSYTLAAKAATVTLAYTDLGDNLSATANIAVSSETILAVVGPAIGEPSTVNAPSDVATTTMPPDSLTQWAGLAAAVEMLMG
jgi:hypothetical protein